MSRTKVFSARMGTGVAAALVFTALCFGVFAQTGGGSAFTDSRDGQKYRTAKIGKQVWMAENLNFKTDSSWCYGDDESNCQKYGRLYDWNAAMKACPAGWKLPGGEEWNAISGNVIGKKLKSKTGWRLPNDDEIKAIAQANGVKDVAGFIAEFKDRHKSVKNNGNGTDTFGFSALPGGSRAPDGSFMAIGTHGWWWSAAEHDGKARFRNMTYGSDGVYEFTDVKSLGFSVRCLQE